MNKLLQEIKKRKIRKWLAIYISSGITSIGVIHLFSIRYHWPNFIFDTVLFTLLFGLVGVTIAAWFHGEEGKQKVKFIEIISLSILFVSLIVTLYFTINLKETSKDKFNKKVIAVLPFSNFNENNETEFFADGMTDDVLTQLSKIADLKIISRTSVMKYKNTNLTIPEISAELGAGTILEGSVRTSGNKIRITGQLIDANNDVHIWSETYDRELQDIFEIQTDIAERIAAALHAKLMPLEKELINKKNTKNLDAYTYYLKGKQYYYNYTENENELAIELFKKALSVDPNYSLALAGLSDAYGQKVSKYWSSDDWADSALALGKKAVKLDERSPEAHKALASAYQTKEEIELALSHYKRSIELNPSYWSAILNYGQLKMFSANYGEALYWIRRANELAPNDIMGILTVAMIYQKLNCDSTAITWAKKAYSANSNHKFANSYLGDLYLDIGDFENARKYFRQSVTIDSNWVFGWFLGGRLESVSGNYTKSKEYFDNYMNITDTYPEYFYAQTLIKLNEIDSAKTILAEEVKDYSSYFSKNKNYQIFNYMAFSEIYAILGEKTKSFEWWGKAISHGYTDIDRIIRYPYLEKFRTEPEYKRLLNKMQTKIDSLHIEIKNQYPDYAECL